jgi:hypothetical protein
MMVGFFSHCQKLNPMLPMATFFCLQLLNDLFLCNQW